MDDLESLFLLPASRPFTLSSMPHLRDGGDSLSLSAGISNKNAVHSAPELFPSTQNLVPWIVSALPPPATA